MKKVLLLLSFLVAFFVSNAQYPVIQWIGRDSALVDSRGGFKARLINYPFTDTTQANTQRISQYAGALIYTTSGGDKLWLRNSTATAWDRIGTSSGGGGGIVSLGASAYGLIIQNDSTYKADTIQLSTRLWRQKGIDSVQGNVTSGLALKLNLSDTASMLTNYVRRQELKDTAAAIRSAIGGGSGSVTSVGSGYGLSGGPITTTGTLSLDSATVSTYYLRRKDSLTSSNLLGYVTRKVLADSMAAIATSYILNEVTTGYDSLSYVEADTLKLKGLRVVAGTNATVTPTITGTTISYSISGNDTTSLSNRINLKLSIADTANMLLNYVRRQELKDTAAAIRAAMGGGATPAGNYGNVQLNRNGAFATPASDSLNFSGGLSIKGTLSATALPTGGVAADSVVVINSSGALKKRNAAAFVTTNGATATGQLALFNGSGTVYSSSKFVYSDATYPSFSIIGTDPLMYFGGTGAAYPSFGKSGNSAVIYAPSSGKSIGFYDQSVGGKQMLRLYTTSGSVAVFNKTAITLDTAVGGPSIGSIHVEYNAGDSTSAATDVGRHMFRGIGRTYANSGSFNTFYSTVEAGNTTYSQDHIIAWQSDAKKTGANTLGIIYHLGILGDSIKAGMVNHRWGVYMYDAKVLSGATLAEQTALRVPKLAAGVRNYDMFSDSAQTVKMDGNILLGDSSLATSARKTLHIFNGTAPSSNISGSIIYSESGELKVRNSAGAINLLSGNAVFSGTLATADPGSGSGSWKLGTAVTTSGLTLNTTTYVEISIGGTVYRLAVVDPPQP